MEASASIVSAPIAYVFLHRSHGVFVAEACELADGLVTATGRSRWATGANYKEFRFGPRESYSCPGREIQLIRWLETEGES
jgi:hypothetical protein